MYFWLNDVELAIERVKIRVAEGGHDIPEDVIRRRYIKGIENLPNFKAISDYWLLIDNSQNAPLFIADGNFEQEVSIFDLDKLQILTHNK